MKRPLCGRGLFVLTMKRKNKLTKLKVTEVSGVDNPANPGAHIIFWKRDCETNIGENGMDIEELKKRLEKLESDNVDLSVLAKMSDAEKDFMAKMDEKSKKEFMALAEEKRKERMKKAADDAKGADDLKKANEQKLGEEIAKALAKTEADLAEQVAKRQELEKEVRKMQEEKAFDAFVAKASKQVPSLASEAKLDFAKSLFAMEASQRDAVISELAAAEKIKTEFMFEKGTSARGSDDPEEQLEKMVKSYQEKNKDLSYGDAYEAVVATAEGKALYTKSLPKAN